MTDAIRAHCTRPWYSLIGDAVYYSLGRLLSQKFLDRYGYWLGFTAARRARHSYCSTVGDE